MNTQNEASLSKPDTAESHFSSFAEPLVEEAISHAAALNADPDAEVLHKLRVALRRMRSLLWAYQPLLDRSFDDKHRDVFKQFGGAAGETRDWDILIKLLDQALGAAQTSTASLINARAAALKTSRETLTNANMRSALQEAIANVNEALCATHNDTSLKKFARRRLNSAARSLHKRMRQASRSRRSDYEAFHEVRKAGKKVRYLLDFFEPFLTRKQLKSAKELKKIQKRFGALNDVVASEALLNANRNLFRTRADVNIALNALEVKRKSRARAAARLLR